MNQTYYILHLYVMFYNELANKMKATNFVFSVFDKLYYRSFMIPMKWTFKDKLGYIKLLIYQSIYSGPLDVDMHEIYCIYYNIIVCGI